jgi:GntR family transcriptional regulator, rspAB operon transcriptional repressor
MTGPERNSPYPFLPALNRDKRGGTVQYIHDVIRDAIVRLEIPPGALIDKSALCERLGVSRFPVSEALGRLAEDGFVEILPQRGTRVTLINLADCREAMFIRRALESDSVRTIALRDDRALLNAIRSNVAAQHAAMKTDDRIAFLCTPQRQASTIAEHERILEALRARDPEAAGRAMEEHLDMVMTELATFSATRPDVFEAKIDESAVA